MNRKRLIPPRRYDFSLFKSVKDKRPQAVSGTLKEFWSLLSTHEIVEDKNYLLWSPASFETAKTRSIDSVESVAFFVADFDDGTSPDEIAANWEGIAHFVHSTFSHTAECPRFRIIAPFKTPITAAEFPKVWETLKHCLCNDRLDESCKDASRIYYLPSCPANRVKEKFAYANEGDLLDPNKYEFSPPRKPENPRANQDNRFWIGLLMELEVYGKDLRTNKHCVNCPNWEAHSEKRPASDSDTVVWIEDGRLTGFKCQHAHCADYGLAEFKRWLAESVTNSVVVSKDASRVYSYLPLYASLSAEDRGRCKAQLKQGLPTLGIRDFERAIRSKSRDAVTDLRNDVLRINTFNRQLRDLVSDSYSALVKRNVPPTLFVSGSSLVRVRILSTDFGEAAKMEPLSREALTGLLTESADFVSDGPDGMLSVNPPIEVSKIILSKPAWPELPVLNGVVTSPIFAPDGSLHATPGYNGATRVYYHEREHLALTNLRCTRSAVTRSVELILSELLGDFPFCDAASQAHALAMFLLPFVRPLIAGPTPIHLIGAPRAGTGKSLLASVVASVFAPQGISVYPAPRDEEEWRKRLTSIFKEGASHSLFDNVTLLNSSSLQAAVTAPDCTWSDRLLGANQTGTYPVRCVWIVTGNNLTGTREQFRRCISIRLDAQTDRPEERDVFKHRNILAWTRDNRIHLLRAAVTLVTHWIGAGRPSYSGRNVLGSFEAWAAVMGGLLETANVEGFLGNQSDLVSQADEEGLLFEKFLRDWWETHQRESVSATDLLPLASTYYEDELGNGTVKSQSIRLGKIMAKHRDYVFNGRALQLREVKGKTQYRLTPVRRGDVRGC